MFINEYFSYDGIDSRSVLGTEISIVRTNTGFLEAPFGVKRKIIEEQIAGRSIPYYFGYTDEPLSFEVCLYKEGVWTFNDKNKIIEWLFKDGYRRFISDDYPSLAFYCMPTSNAKKMLTANNEGYITIEFRCDSPYAWTYPAGNNAFNISNNRPQDLLMYNRSNIVSHFKPVITIKITEDTDYVTLINTSYNNLEFKIGSDKEGRKLQKDEVIYIDNANKQIITNVPNIYRYSDFNKNWLVLKRGENVIKAQGKCIINVYYEYPMTI